MLSKAIPKSSSPSLRLGPGRRFDRVQRRPLAAQEHSAGLHLSVGRHDFQSIVVARLPFGRPSAAFVARQSAKGPFDNRCESESVRESVREEDMGKEGKKEKRAFAAAFRL